VKLQLKISLAMAGIGLSLLVILTGIYHVQTSRTIRQNTLAESEATVQEFARHLNSYLAGQASVGLTLASAPVLREALLASNATFAAMTEAARLQEIQRLEQRWSDAPNPEALFVQTYMDNPVASYLSQQDDLLPNHYGEIFLTDRYGVLVGTTSKLTTLAHGTKYWWQAAYNHGQGRVFFDDRGFDASVQDYVFGVVIPVMDGPEVIGLLKSNVNIVGPLTDLLNFADDEMASRVQIVRTGGLVVAAKGVEPLSLQLEPELVQLLASQETGSAVIDDGQESKIVAFTPVSMTLGSTPYAFGGQQESIDQSMGNAGESWHVVITTARADILPLTRNSVLVAAMLGLVLVLLISGSALLFGAWVSRPLVDLAETVRSFRAGNLSVRTALRSQDEVGQLAQDFNRMAEDLESSYQEVEGLYAEVRSQAQQLAEKSDALIESNSELQNFVYMASHDLQAPLRAITSYLQLIQRRYADKLDERGNELVERAVAASLRMSDLIMGLLAFSRAGASGEALAALELTGLVGAVVSDLRVTLSRSGATLTVDPMPTVLGNAAHITQLFNHLLDNALKYRRDVPPEIHVGVTDGGDVWQFAVSDNGLGIAEKDMERVFHIFERLHSQSEFPGAGIGLAVCKRIVEYHGGQIWLESQVDQGSTFFFTLRKP